MGAMFGADFWATCGPRFRRKEQGRVGGFDGQRCEASGDINQKGVQFMLSVSSGCCCLGVRSNKLSLATSREFVLKAPRCPELSFEFESVTSLQNDPGSRVELRVRPSGKVSNPGQHGTPCSRERERLHPSSLSSDDCIILRRLCSQCNDASVVVRSRRESDELPSQPVPLPSRKYGVCSQCIEARNRALSEE